MKYFLLFSIMALAACTMVPNKGKPSQAWPDASTLLGFNEYNGGIYGDVTINGRGYNAVTTNLAAKVEKWQSSKNGFTTTLTAIDEHGVKLVFKKPVTAIDKGVMFFYDSQ